MKLKNKHREMQRHLQKMVQSGSGLDQDGRLIEWGVITITDDLLMEYIIHESTGRGSPHPALLDVKRREDLLVKMWWEEMADCWANGFGWWYVWRDNLSKCWNDRGGSNILVRKLIAIMRGIEVFPGGHDFMGALIRYSGFSTDERNRYLIMWERNNFPS